jgi:hypothetical protein
VFGYKKYTVFFEVYGKKMKTDVMAASEQKAKDIVKDSITIHKVMSEDMNSSDVEQIFQKLKEIFK